MKRMSLVTAIAIVVGISAPAWSAEFATKDEAVAMVKKAVAFIGQQGVEKAYAIHAGREIRVIVEPDKLNDSEVMFLAKDIAKKIEADMAYPGEIKVTVLREVRAIEYAR